MSAPHSSPQLMRPVVATVWTLWLIGMASFGRWNALEEGWMLSLTMVFGSFIAGATSEGGGAVAFPVMTLLLGIQPAVARDFALCIQAVGMTSAAYVILRSRTPVVGSALGIGSVAGAVGLVLGLELLAPLVSPPVAKLAFTSIWLAFGLVLLVAQRNPARRDPAAPYTPNTLALVVAGLFGGAVVSVAGSGLDICIFSYLVLRGRVSESVATPTSVVLMGANALFGAVYRELAMDGIAPEAWTWWWACVPIVVVGAPLGALAIRHIRRTQVVALLLASIAVQYVAAVLILPMSPSRWLLSVACFVSAAAVFGLVGRRGGTVLEDQSPDGTTNTASGSRAV